MIDNRLADFPPDQQKQARDLLVERAAISSTSTDMETAMRRHERTQRLAKYGAGIALGIGAVAGAVGFFNKPIFMVLLTLFLVTVFVTAGYRELGLRKFMCQQRDSFILARYDRLLNKLRNGSDLTDEELTKHNLQITHLIHSSPSGPPIFVQIGLGVLLAALCFAAWMYFTA